ncbi:CBS domain-containing protein [Thiocapsa rosea]|nr:CBS domain-containing protein [Thiocapsa rosea]
MTQNPFTVSEQTSMKEAVLMLDRHHIRHLPVTNGSRVVGMVTDRDIRRASPSLQSGIEGDYEQVLAATPVARIMTKEPVTVMTVTEDTPLVDAVRAMVEKKFGALPVVRGEELIGIISEIDALKLLAERKEVLPMRIGEYMIQKLFTVPEEASMKEAVSLLGRHHIRHLPVTNGSRLVGMVTDRDIRRATPSLLSGIRREDFEQVLVATSVARIMTKEPVTVTEDTPLVDAVRVMVEKKFGSLPVVRGEDLIGIFTDIDALKVLLEELE